MVGCADVAHTAKGFTCIRPAFQRTRLQRLVRRLFIDEPDNYSLRRYDDEQWDVMFFLQGRAEMILCDVRGGFPSASCASLSMVTIIAVTTTLAWSFRPAWRMPFGGRLGRRDHGLRDEHDFPSRVRRTNRERDRNRAAPGIVGNVFKK